MSNTIKSNNHISAIIKDCLNDLDFKRRHPKELLGISTGYDYLDAKLDGLKAGEVTIIGARPAMGKTSFATNLVYNIAAGFYAKYQQNPSDDKCVAYVCLELSPKLFAQRLMSLQSQIPIHKIRKGLELDKTFDKLCQTQKAFNVLPIYCLEDCYIDNMAEELQQLEKTVGCLVIDYLQLFREENPLIEDYSSIMFRFKSLAVKLNIPVIVLSQLKRELETRDDKRPLCCDIRGFDRNQSTADNILFLYREIYYIAYDEPIKRKRETEEHYQNRLQAWQKRCNEVGNLCEIIIAKNANGCYGSVKMRFNWETGLFTEWREG